MSYEWVKALHIISVISWMAGMLYLPRLFVYHSEVAIGSEMDQKFQLMEKRLLRYIMNPAMIATFIFGFWVMAMMGVESLGGWLHVKIMLVLIMAAIHGLFAKCRKDFAAGKNKHDAKFYRIINEIPTALMILIVILAVVKPF